MPPKQDFLKYWRVVRYYVKAKYKLTTPDLEMLLFLYSEKYFSRTDFGEYEQIMAWDRNRFDRLRTNGWLDIFRKPNRKAGVGARYKLSHKAEAVIKTMYQFLNGVRDLSENKRRNPLSRDDSGYSAKRYVQIIKKMNREYKKLREEKKEEL